MRLLSWLRLKPPDADRRVREAQSALAEARPAVEEAKPATARARAVSRRVLAGGGPIEDAMLGRPAQPGAGRGD